MSQPPFESGNVVDPEVLASRRARRAEVGEDASLELRLFEAERRVGEVAAERDALRARIATFERDLRGTRQREWAEQQQRLEAQGEAAATRELAGAQLAELRERLSEAEAELAVVAAERDRTRTALEDERLRATAERERREALEREGVVLRAELARRDELTSAAADAVAAARRELAAGRVAAVAGVEDVEARLVAERRELAARVVAVERAVVAVRERLGAAARVLRERLEVERTARLAAEAALGAERGARASAEGALDAERGARVAAEGAADGARAHAAELERELARREAAEAELRAALEAVGGELAAVRAGDAERIARLATRVETVVGLATDLRDGMRRDLGAEHEALTASLAAMQARVAELQARLAEAAGLREELEAERAARWVAEAELDAERRRGDEDRAARAAAESRLAEAERELEDLRTGVDAPPRPAGADPATVASLREALAHLRAPAADGADGDADTARRTPALGLDLAAAAARLRATAEAAEAEAEADTDASDSADAPDVEGATGKASVASADDEPALAPAATPTLQPLPERVPVAEPGPWLRDALQGLAADEPDIAELLLVALLPAQAGLVKGALTYELAIEGGTTQRVVVDAERARVEPTGAGTVDARVSGPLAALVPLAAGGARRRLPGAQVEGRRRLRRLLKARRAPLGLAELAAAGVAPSPGVLLTVLARAVDPSWTAGRPLAVDVAAEGADCWRVVASGGGPLAIVPAAGAPPAPAILRTSAGRLLAVLAGTAAPGDAHVEGDVRDVRTLLSWLDRAQRVGR